MGSARDSAPDPNHTSGMARSSVPMRLRSRLHSAPASASSRQSSRAILPTVDRVTSRATVYALAREDQNAPTEWGWQCLCPQEKRWVNPRTGE